MPTKPSLDETRAQRPAPQPTSSPRAIVAALALALVTSAACKRDPVWQELGAALPKTGQWRQGFTVADVDGDEKLDVVHGPARKDARTPHVWRGDGAGGFSKWTEARFPAVALDYGDVDAADVDGDGDVDLAFAVHLGGLVLLLQTAPGVFTAAGAGLPLPSARGPFSSRALSIADWNVDGKPDLVALADTPGVAWPGVQVFLQGEGGSFARATNGAAPVYGDDLFVVDLDGDGRTDALTADHVFGDTRIVARNVGGTEGAVATMSPAVPPKAYVRAVAAAELDGDRVMDVVLAVQVQSQAGWSAQVLVAPRGGAGDARVVFERAGRTQLGAVTGGDVDGDGHVDLVVGAEDGVVVLLRGDGRGGFTATDGPPMAARAGCAVAHLVLADVDADGRAEVFVSSAGDGDVPGTCVNGGALQAFRFSKAR